MASITDLINEYQDVAVSPRDLRNMAAIAVKNASIQDNAVANAIGNAQAVEMNNRNNLEKYLLAADEQASAEAKDALQRAASRLSQIEQSLSLYGTAMMQTREGKRDAARLRAEREQILSAFPQLGFANGGVQGAQGVDIVDEFNVKDWLANGDWSQGSVKRLFDEGTAEDVDEAVRTGNLDLYQAMLDSRLGALPDGVAEKMRFVVGGMPQLSKDLKLNDKYARLRPILGETQGDLKDKDKKDKAAAAKAAKAKAFEKRKTAALLILEKVVNAEDPMDAAEAVAGDKIEELRWLNANGLIDANKLNTVKYKLDREDI